MLEQLKTFFTSKLQLGSTSVAMWILLVAVLVVVAVLLTVIILIGRKSSKKIDAGKVREAVADNADGHKKRKAAAKAVAPKMSMIQDFPNPDELVELHPIASPVEEHGPTQDTSDSFMTPLPEQETEQISEDAPHDIEQFAEEAPTGGTSIAETGEEATAASYLSYDNADAYRQVYPVYGANPNDIAAIVGRELERAEEKRRLEQQRAELNAKEAALAEKERQISDQANRKAAEDEIAIMKAELETREAELAEKERLALEAEENAKLEAQKRAEEERLAAEEAANQERLAAEEAAKKAAEDELNARAAAIEAREAELAEKERLALEAEENARLEAQKRAEEERLAAEEAANQERLARENAELEAQKRAEEERLAAEEAANQERLAAEEAAKKAAEDELNARAAAIEAREAELAEKERLALEAEENAKLEAQKRAEEKRLADEAAKRERTAAEETAKEAARQELEAKAAALAAKEAELAEKERLAIEAQENAKRAAAAIGVAAAVTASSKAPEADASEEKKYITKAPAKRPSRPLPKGAPSKVIAVKKLVPTALQETPSNSAAPAAEEGKIVSIIKLNDDKIDPTKGKYVIIRDALNLVRPYKFQLRANNGQILFESEGYKIKPRAKQIQTFKNAIANGLFTFDQEKNGTYRFKLLDASGKLFGVGETYKTLDSAERASESVKNFAQSANFIEDLTAD